MRTTFYYKEQKSKVFGKIKRPIAEVWLIGDKEIKETFYIDSGADITLIPRSVGELIGLKFENDNIVDLYGIGDSSISVLIKEVKIRIGKHEFPIKLGWALTEKIPSLLGRKDIFDKFNVNFKENQEVIEFDWVGD